VDGRLAGFIAWQEGWVDHLYVDPQHHGRGIGRALLDEAKADQPHLNLWVFQVNHRARRFYERQGFTLAEETDGSGNEEREPDARYVWSRAEAS
jgi:GNAT superfamily N-acetyltransferase